jgi:predicted PurR-regulated permease PerM
MGWVMSDFFHTFIQLLLPFLAAFIFAYILEPVTKKFVQLGLPKALAAFFTLCLGVIVGVLIFLLLLNLIHREVPLIKSQFPFWIKNIQEMLDPLLTRFEISLDWNSIKSQVQSHISAQISDNANTIVTQTLEAIVQSSGSILGFIAHLLLVLFVLFYLLLEWDTFLRMIGDLIPCRYRLTISTLLGEVDQLLSQYLRGQLLVMLVLAIFYSIGLRMIGLESAIPLGVFTGLVAFVPYVGILMSVSLSLTSALLQFGPSNDLLAVLALYGSGQFLEGFFLTPRLVGERIGLHPVGVLFALTVFGQFFGFFGILLALPSAAICLVSIRYFKQRYQSSKWFNSPPSSE